MIKPMACTAFLVLATIVSAQSTQPAQRGKDKGQKDKKSKLCLRNCDEKKYDLASSTITGDIVRGPRTITAENLNPLRYDYKWNNAITFQAAPDLWSKLTSINASTTTQAPQTQPSKAQGLSGERIPPDIQNAIESARRLRSETDAQIKRVTDQKTAIDNNFNDLVAQQAIAGRATNQVSEAGKALTDFLSSSQKGPQDILTGIKDQLASTTPGAGTPAAKDSVFVSGIKASWADQVTVARIHDSSQLLANQLDNLKSEFAAYIPRQTAQLESARKDLTALRDKLQGQAKTASQIADLGSKIKPIADEVDALTAEETNLATTGALLDWEMKVNSQIVSASADLDVGSSKYIAFKTAQDLLIKWQRRMETLQDQWHAYSNDPAKQSNPFSMSIAADCEFAFSRTKLNAITLSRSDVMPGSTSTSSETVLSVTVECTSPFTVSAGVAFSTIPEREFAIQAVPSGSTTVNEFVYSAKSSFHPLPIGMVHARLWEPNECFSFHLSFGIAANIRGQNSGGSDPEYLIGPSFALFRTMFFTPGLHLGREVSLADGFKVGGVVPSNITTPPLQKSYTAGFGFAITFTKP
jgi:hypothetical protein